MGVTTGFTTGFTTGVTMGLVYSWMFFVSTRSFKYKLVIFASDSK
jgi:hypothetical protein